MVSRRLSALLAFAPAADGQRPVGFGEPFGQLDDGIGIHAGNLGDLLQVDTGPADPFSISSTRKPNRPRPNFWKALPQQSPSARSASVPGLIGTQRLALAALLDNRGSICTTGIFFFLPMAADLEHAHRRSPSVGDAAAETEDIVRIFKVETGIASAAEKFVDR